MEDIEDTGNSIQPFTKEPIQDEDDNNVPLPQTNSNPNNHIQNNIIKSPQSNQIIKSPTNHKQQEQNTTPVRPSSKSPKRRWLDSVTTPEKDTQGSSTTFRKKRKGVEVSRLYKLIEQKKTEEMAARHIIASRQNTNIPDSNARVVIKAGRVIGNLFKTFCVAVDPSCSIREVHVIFPLERKMEFSLAPGVTLNLIPPWQEFSENSNLILCSTFEVISRESTVTLDQSLIKRVNSPSISKQSIFCPPTMEESQTLDNILSHLFRSKDNQENNDEENEEDGDIKMDNSQENISQISNTNIENVTDVDFCKTIQGIIVKFISHISLDELSQLNPPTRSLLEWFEGFNISKEENFTRTKRQNLPHLLVQNSSDSFILIEIPLFLWEKWLGVLSKGVEGIAVKISDLTIISDLTTNINYKGLIPGSDHSLLYARFCKNTDIEEIPKDSLDFQYDDPFYSSPNDHLFSLKQLSSPDFIPKEGMRYNLIGKASYVISDSISYSRSPVNDIVFLFQPITSSDYYTK